MRSGKIKVRFPVQGQRSGFCRQCHAKDDKPWYHHSPVKALYVREPKKGFVRIGWLFVECGHVELDKEGVQSGVSIALEHRKVKPVKRLTKADIEDEQSPFFGDVELLGK